MDGLPQHRRLLSGVAVVAAATALIAVFTPERVAEVLWRYFAGPVVADALDRQVATFNGVAAERGYTAVSIGVYAAVLVAALPVLRRGLRRFAYDLDGQLVLSLVPFIVFGGLLRVVEDAGLLPFPWNTVLISPLIYVLLGASGLAVLALGQYLAAKSSRYGFHQIVRGIGAGAAFLTMVVVAVARAGHVQAGASPLILGVPLGAIAIAIGIQSLVARRFPGTLLSSTEGRIAVTGQVLDGAVTAVIVTFLGGTEKLPLSAAIIDTFHPAAFPAVKLGITLAFLGMVRRDDTDVWTALMVLVLIAVGLGPGTRNLTRALFGV